MKASDYIADALHMHGVKIIFEMVGGMITHIIDSIHQKGKIRIVSMHHEQAAGFAAEAVGRICGVPGVALATSGPGATNLVTAIGSCYFDSIPTVFITGQVNTSELSEGRPVRQQGFQETDIVSIVTPITKGAWQVKTADELPEVLENAFTHAMEGRPGPVLVDIPMNVQRENMAVPKEPRVQVDKANEDDLRDFVQRIVETLDASQNPLILAGGGIRSAGGGDLFRQVVEAIGIPVVLSLMGLDLLPYEHPKRVGMIGTYGNRWANQALMASDTLLVLGSRMDVRQTGGDLAAFMGTRKIIHIDCDSAQLNNRVDGCETCVSGLAEFLSAMLTVSRGMPTKLWPKWEQWILAKRLLSPDVKELDGCKGINPNEFVHVLSQGSHRAAIYLADVGKNQMWMAQSIELQKDQRFLVSGGMGSMGFALPAAIGSVFASNQAVVCVMGDGGIQCNIQELETIHLHKLPVKMVVINNNSLGMVGQFQEEYFESRMCSTVWGYSAPNFEDVALAYKISARTIQSPEEMAAAVKWLWEDPSSPALLNVLIDSDTKVFPKAAYGRPINDMDPRFD